tara:strand:+ start:210 stop:656 length:447 start_codon:yes stop_codon:yes gene_type:complete
MNKLYILSFFILLGCQEKDSSFSIESQNNTGQLEDTGTIDSGNEDSPNEDSPVEDACILDPNTENADPTELTGRPECGEEVYLNRCSGCHGNDGEGTPNGQKLDGELTNHIDDEIIASIVNGEGEMPPQNLHPQEVADVLDYLRIAFP